MTEWFCTLFCSYWIPDPQHWYNLCCVSFASCTSLVYRDKVVWFGCLFVYFSKAGGEKSIGLFDFRWYKRFWYYGTCNGLLQMVGRVSMFWKIQENIFWFVLTVLWNGTGEKNYSMALKWEICTRNALYMLKVWSRQYDIS